MLQEEISNITDQLETEKLSESESDSDDCEGKIIYSEHSSFIVGVTKSKLFSFVCALLESSNTI